MSPHSLGTGAPIARKNHIGAFSLLTMSGGFVVMEALHHVGITAAPAWGILQSGFEAGMVAVAKASPSWTCPENGTPASAKASGSG